MTRVSCFSSRRPIPTARMPATARRVDVESELARLLRELERDAAG
jgi:hypothetical protein